jgi:hypothetical protein
MMIKTPLKKLLNRPANKYDTGDELYSLKTGKLYGTVHGSLIGDRGAEYVHVIKPNGKFVTKSRKKLDRLVRQVRDEKKHAEMLEKRERAMQESLDKIKSKFSALGIR